MLSSSSAMSSSFNPLLTLGDHSSHSSPSSSTSSRGTFTRVSRVTPSTNTSGLLFPSPSSNTSSPSTSYFSLSKSPSTSSSSSSPLSECTAKTTEITTPMYSRSNTNTGDKHSQHGLNRFRPSLHNSATSNFLEDIPSLVNTPSTSSFTALRRIDRKDIQLDLDPVPVLLSQDELAEKYVASTPYARFSSKNSSPNSTTADSLLLGNDNNNNKAASKPCPTFTRITKPRTPTPPTTLGSRTGFYRLGDSGSSNTSTKTKSTSAGLDLLLGSETLSFPSASLLHEESTKETMPSLCLSTSSPSSSCVPSPWSPPSSSSLSCTKQPAHQQSLKAPTLLLPPLSLSLSPPPSSVPSLSSSASSACSSASSSSSPPTSHFLFPTVDHHDWWQGLGSPTASPSGLEQGDRGTGSRTEPGTASGSSLNSMEDLSSLSLSGQPTQDLLSSATTTAPSSHTFYRQQPQSRESLKSDDLLDKDPVVNHLAFTTAGSVGLDLTTSNNQNKDSITGKNSDGSIPAGTTSPTTTLSTRKTYSLARARAPSPPHVITGFCSISKTPIKPSGEPSPQDFLGEADLPYPLPSTLHDRQTRQRKRAEQLRQLKIREDCEAEEKNNNSNRRRVFRRRGASFSAGMVYSPSTSLALSPPSSNSTPSSPALFSDSPRMQSLPKHQQHNTASFRSPAWHQQRLSLNQHLKRCPSSPARGSSSVNNLHLVNRHSTCNIGQGSKEKALLSELATLPSPPPRRRVVFDLENIQVFEYDVSGDDWSPSSGPSSPTMPPASTNGRDSYVRYVPPSDCSSSGSSDEDSPSPRVPIRDLKSKA